MAGVAGEGSDDKGERKPPIIRDIRRYYCDFCGICRSKKSLIRSHILSNHKDEMQEAQSDDSSAEKASNTCASFKKPAYLKQHMQSHSLECSLRRKRLMNISSGLSRDQTVMFLTSGNFAVCKSKSSACEYLPDLDWETGDSGATGC